MRYLHNKNTMLIPNFQNKPNMLLISDYTSSKLILILWQLQIFLYKESKNVFIHKWHFLL